MDYTITAGARNWCLSPLTERARNWLAQNYSSTSALTVPADHGPMFVRALRSYDFELSPLGEEGPHDFDDQYSMFLRALSRRLAGRDEEALVSLVNLRASVCVTTDPKSSRLLPAIDREISAAHNACRTD